MLRGDVGVVKEVLGVLERIDRPQPQVRLRASLLVPVDQADGADGALDAELEASLAKLVPGTRFRREGFALLTAMVPSEGGVRASLGIHEGERFELRFEPVAYDPRGQALSVRECSLVRYYQSAEGDAGRGSLFTADMVFRAGERTIAGASDEETVFVIVEIEAVD